MARLTGCGKADRSTLHAMDTEEHDKVFSRTLGRMVEIGVNKVGGNLVPANPFASEAQRGYMHAHSEVLGKTALKEWDTASKGKSLPKRVKK